MVENRKFILSKFALSNVFHFLEIPKALELRRVNSIFDAACVIGLTIQANYDLTDTVDRCNYIIETKFPSEKVEEHKELRATQIQINVDLSNFLTEAVQTRSHLFTKYTDVVRMLKPNGLIIKPIFCAMVLRHTMPKQDANFNWNDWG